ncbi:MAG: hypothetical protein HKP14_04370 [Bacteroidia bacterium]|nr:hypothetical protein [Bacteroidia bacterium]
MVSSNFNIADLAKNPSQLGKAEAEWLELQIEREPWCSAYRILLSKAYFNEDSFLKNKHLRLAAAYAGNREVLFNFIHEPVLAAKESDVLVEDHLQEVDANPVEDSLEDTVVPIEEEMEAVQEEPAIEEDLKIELDSTSEPIEIIPEKEVVSEKEISEPLKPFKEEVPEIIQETIEKSEETKPKIDFDKVVTYDPTKELKAEPIVPEPDHDPIPFDTVVYNPEVELNKIIEEKEEAEETGEKDFMFWLNHMDDEPQKTKKPKESAKSPSNVQNLLDQFLATKRSKPIQSREFYNAQNKAQQSETDTMSVVSETLLKIYERQGYYEKAIEGYNKLSLQNPSKSAYFAARITELKEKQSIQ